MEPNSNYLSKKRAYRFCMFIRTLKKGGEILRLSAMPVKHIDYLYFLSLIY